MIRRQVAGETWLISQNDHAVISGELASKLGNRAFAVPTSSSVLLGITLHDCGWPIHDEDAPTLNGEGRPLDVFETPRELGLRVWEESAERAAKKDDYAGLLVSLHGLGLSVFATATTATSPIKSDRRGPWDMSDPRAKFELNRFQHRMIELQESFRQRLGLRTDRPLRNGLAEESLDPKEQRLAFDFRWLQAMDRLSLAICCTTPPFTRLEPVLPKPGAQPVSIRVVRPDDGTELQLEPWIFADARISVEVPFRRLSAERFESELQFRDALQAASVERFTVTLRPLTI